MSDSICKQANGFSLVPKRYQRIDTGGTMGRHVCSGDHDRQHSQRRTDKREGVRSQAVKVVFDKSRQVQRRCDSKNQPTSGCSEDGPDGHY